MAGARGKCFLASRPGEEGPTRLNLAGRSCPPIPGFVRGFCSGFAVLWDNALGQAIDLWMRVAA
jgi:hypothetical protein